MTSANVSNMTMQVAASNASANKTEKSNARNDFLQVMSSNMQGKTTDMEISAANKSTTVDNAADTAAKVNAKPNEIKTVEKEPMSEEAVTKTREEVEDFAEKVKDVISEELDVSDEEIVQAMETLGLTFLDLTNTTNLAELVSKLTGSENNVVLLIDESFTDILSQVNGLTDAIVKATGFQPEELQSMTDRLDAMLSMEEQIPADDALNQELSVAEDAVVSPEMQIPETPATEETEEIATQTVAVTAEAVQEKPELAVSQGDTKQAEAVDTNAEETEVSDKTTEKEVAVDAPQTEKQSAKEEKQSFDFNGSRPDATPEAGHLQPTMGTQIIRYEPVTGEITLQTGEVVDVRDVIDQIVESARTNITAENTTIELLLHPEDLGKILVEVTEEHGKVTAKIFTQDETVKQALENQMVQLRDQMNNSGTRVNSIEVEVGTHEFEKNLEEGQQDRQQEETNHQQGDKKSRNINLNNLDELSGLMTEEEELVAKMMREDGNTVNFTA